MKAKDKEIAKLSVRKKSWPVEKFWNKFWVFNLVTIFGCLMLFLSIFFSYIFNNNQKKIISNIILSGTVAGIGIFGDLIYTILLVCIKPEVKCNQLLNGFLPCFWIPVVGLILGLIWRIKEKLTIWETSSTKITNKVMFKLPNSITILFVALILIVFVIWILYILRIIDPSDPNIKDNSCIIPGIFDIFYNPLKGFQVAAPIIIFLYVFNGAMTLVNDTHAIEAGIGALLRKIKGKEFFIIPVLMLILAVLGSTLNTCEELLPLFLIIIPIFFVAGYDRMTGFLIVFMSAGVGIMASTINPILIGTAIASIQEIADAHNVTIVTGIVWRLIMFAVLVSVCITCTMIYAWHVKKNPTKSCVYMSKQDFAKKYNFNKDALPPLTQKHIWSLFVFGLAFLIMIIGFIDWKTMFHYEGFNWLHNQLLNYFPFISSAGEIGTWGMLEATMLFLVAAIIIGAINWQGIDHWFKVFYDGCKDFIGVAFIIAVARGLSITLTNSGFNTFIANWLGSLLAITGSMGAILLIFAMTSILTLFITSSSGLASAMFPTIGPAVLNVNASLISGSLTSFAAAMGWVNLFTPAGMLLPFLETSKLNIKQFIKVAWIPIVILLICGIGLLALGSVMPIESKMF